MEDLQMLKKNWIYKRGDIYLANLGTPAGSVYKLLGQNEFRWFKIGSAIRISARSFDEWLDSKL